MKLYIGDTRLKLTLTDGITGAAVTDATVAVTIKQGGTTLQTVTCAQDGTTGIYYGIASLTTASVTIGSLVQMYVNTTSVSAGTGYGEALHVQVTGQELSQ